MPLSARPDFPTHIVENQPDARVPGLWTDDLPLRDGLAANDGPLDPVQTYAEMLSASEMQLAVAMRTANPRSCVYDPSVRPLGQKQAVTLGMAMTEKQGGSDVRANTTIAGLMSAR